MRRVWTIDDFVISKKLGGGQYSKVYLAKEAIIKKTVALKVISNANFGKKISEEQFLKEIKIQHRLNHTNIVKLFGFFDDDKARYIVLEFCERGEMYEDIKLCKGYSNNRAATYVYQLAHALEYLFNHRVIHRDIKAENILISASGAVKLADFGWTACFKNRDRHTFCGTPEYMSPDILCGCQQNEKVDIWCLGVLLYEMLTTKTPFFNFDQNSIYSNIKNVTFTVPTNVDIFAKYLIINILRKNIYERLNAWQIIVHPFVLKFAEKTLTECKAAFVQWSNLDSEPVNVNMDTWSFEGKCPTIDLNNVEKDDIDIDCPDFEVVEESFSLMKELNKKNIGRKI